MTLPTVASALLLLTALLVAGRGALEPARQPPALFRLRLAIGWALVTARLWWHDLPLSNFDSELLLACLPPLVALAAVQFLIALRGLALAADRGRAVRAMRRRAGAACCWPARCACT